jgi:predicted RNA-binding Zn-ribbon protein involved in translation (DUF1610 family)
MKHEILMAALGLASTTAWSAENVTRDKVDTLLQELAAKPAPTKLAPAAMCYAPALPPTRAEYVCPVCGAKTIHEGATARTAAWTVEHYRSCTKKLDELGLAAKLDETFLCSACRPSDAPAGFFLEVTLDGRTIRNSVESKDFALLEAFLSGKAVWGGNFGDEHPLKDEMPRVRKLLGVPEPEGEKPPAAPAKN